VKTDDLIAALVEDRQATPPPARLLARSLPFAVLGALLLMLVIAGLRENLAQVATDPRFLFKLLVTLALAIPALGLLTRLASPVSRTGGWGRALWLAPLLLLAAVLIELALLPGVQWAPAALGHNAAWCLLMVPLLAILPLAAGIYCLRLSAPASPARAGAVAGLASGALAAAIYALHCTDDSPLFVGVWYTIAVLFISGVGALAASRLARW
jgi:hypothetical protein